MKIRNDSLYKWGDAIYDEDQERYVWGLCDPPDPTERDDDQFYTITQGDRFDMLAHKYYGNTRLFWVIMHYNNISDAMTIEDYVGQQIRIPSKITVRKVYTDGTQ